MPALRQIRGWSPCTIVFPASECGRLPAGPPSASVLPLPVISRARSMEAHRTLLQWPVLFWPQHVCSSWKLSTVPLGNLPWHPVCATHHSYSQFHKEFSRHLVPKHWKQTEGRAYVCLAHVSPVPNTCQQHNLYLLNEQMASSPYSWLSQLPFTSKNLLSAM